MDAHVAHADAAEVEGALRAGAARLRGIRVSSSGLPAPQWNTADVTGPDADLDAARAFFGALPWGFRVPAGMDWQVGRRLFSQPLMTLAAGTLRPPPEVAGLEIRAAGPEDIDTVLAVDGAAFGSDPEEGRRWAAPHLDSPRILTVLAVLGGEPVATAYTIRSDGEAGPALLLAGVGVVPAARRRGIAAHVSAHLLARGFAGGAAFAHLHADTPGAARVYRRLGFRDAGAIDIYAQ
jgi:ribosomal protein S18 acetylase RimI-like enzyme